MGCGWEARSREGREILVQAQGVCYQVIELVNAKLSVSEYLGLGSSCTRKLDPQPTDEQLKAVRERLAKGYEKLRGQLEKKGWIKNRGKLPGDFEY